MKLGANSVLFGRSMAVLAVRAPRLARSLELRHTDAKTAKAELKSLMPDEAQQAIGRGIRAKRSKSGAISFDLLPVEAQSNAAV